MNRKEASDYWERLNWSFPTINGLCNDLNKIGAEAMVVTEEGLNELHELVIHPKTQYIGVTFSHKQFGIVEIKRSPIKWIRLYHVDLGWIGGTDLGDNYEMQYIVPDSRRLPCVNASPKYVKQHSILDFGKIKDVKWSFESDADVKNYPEKGNKLSKNHITELEQHLNNDKELKNTILSSHSLLDRFSSVCPFWLRCWIIGTATDSHFPAPSIEEWSCYERIASLLLKAPVSM